MFKTLLYEQRTRLRHLAQQVTQYPSTFQPTGSLALPHYLASRRNFLLYTAGLLYRVGSTVPPALSSFMLDRLLESLPLYLSRWAREERLLFHSGESSPFFFSPAHGGVSDLQIEEEGAGSPTPTPGYTLLLAADHAYYAGIFGINLTELPRALPGVDYYLAVLIHWLEKVGELDTHLEAVADYNSPAWTQDLIERRQLLEVVVRGAGLEMEETEELPGATGHESLLPSSALWLWRDNLPCSLQAELAGLALELQTVPLGDPQRDVPARLLGDLIEEHQGPALARRLLLEQAGKLLPGGWILDTLDAVDRSFGKEVGPGG